MTSQYLNYTNIHKAFSRKITGAFISETFSSTKLRIIEKTSAEMSFCQVNVNATMLVRIKNECHNVIYKKRENYVMNSVCQHNRKIK